MATTNPLTAILETLKRKAKPAKPAICCKCGKDLKSKVPLDATEVTCFACDNMERPDAKASKRRKPARSLARSPTMHRGNRSVH